MASYLSFAATAMLVVLLAPRQASAQSGSNCTTALTSLAPCLGFATGSAKEPSVSCCTQFGSVFKTEPQCLCSAIAADGGTSQFIKINETLAMQLPKLCGVATPAASQCKSVAGGPSPSLVAAKSTPLQGGSKGTTSSHSDGNGVKISSLFVIFATIVASIII